MQATSDIRRLDPPERRLCGPGPTDVEQRVLDAMQRPMLGHLDPELQVILGEVVARLRELYRRREGITLPLSGTGMTGMEAGMASLVEPGDKVIVAVAGFFAERIADVARRQQAHVEVVDSPWGEHVPSERLLEALREHPDARLLALVHAETSTGVRYPLEELSQATAGTDALLMVDCVTSLGGVEVDADGWGLDYCFSCTQKCLGAPPGMSPVSVSERALERIRSRRTPVPFTFDLERLGEYWNDRPAVYHHTVPVLAIYALHEALRLLLEEGLVARWRRHADAGAYLQGELRERGFDLLADERHQLPQLTAVRVPEGIDGAEVQKRILTEHGVEVGGGLGPDAPAMWRIGLMGANATRATADVVLQALDAVLERPAALAKA